MKKKGGKHTGKLVHEDMTSIIKNKGKDKHAHSSHHEMNRKMGMPEGMAPKDDGLAKEACCEDEQGEME